MSERIDIDLCLSGSGVRLPAHLGALYALVESEKFNIKRVAGTSGGSIIASAYLAFRDYSCDPITAVTEIKRLIFATNFERLIKDSRIPIINLFRKTGMYPGKKFEKFIYDKVTYKTMREYNDLYVVTTDVISRDCEIIHASTFPTLTIAQAVRRSMSIPVVFFPIYRTIKGIFHAFTDGGVSNNYPIDIFDDGKRPTIGIKLHSAKSKKLKKQIKKRKLSIKTFLGLVLSTLMDSIEREHIEDSTKWAQTISVNTGNVSSFDFDLTNEEKIYLYNQGYEKAKKWLAKTDVAQLKVT